MTTTRERSINLRDWEVRAIQAGRLKMLVRPVKPQPISPGDGAYFDAYNGGPEWTWWTPDNRQYLSQIIRCPYGKAGDRLRGREAFDVSPEPTGWEGHHWLTYVADGDRIEVDCAEFYMGRLKPGKRYPSIHMPRWAVRNWLEITEVRCGRVREMSEEDAEDRGCPECETCRYECGQWGRGAIDDPLSNAFGGRPWMSCHGICDGKTAREWYACQYDTDHGAGAWDRNDWVWMIGVKRIDGGQS